MLKQRHARTEARYVQCESAHATELSPVHIRRIESTAELRPNGGPPEKSLCGRQTAWDIEERDMERLVEWSKEQRRHSAYRPGLLCTSCIEVFDAR